MMLFIAAFMIGLSVGQSVKLPKPNMTPMQTYEKQADSSGG